MLGIAVIPHRAIVECELYDVAQVVVGISRIDFAEVQGKPYYLLDKFNFMDVVLTRIWPH